MAPLAVPETATWLSEQDCVLEDFRALIEQATDLTAFPTAGAVESKILIYEATHLREATEKETGRQAVQAELARALLDGPGVILVRNAFDPSVVDRATTVFATLIDEEIAAGKSGGDHFAKPGTNARLWDSLSKLAARDPDVFVDYFSNDVLALVSLAWLGPGYQVTSQVNLVNPGGVAQAVHRDYHLGFMSNERAASFPAHVHRLSPCSPCRVRSPVLTCRLRAGRRSMCPIRRNTFPVTWPGACRNSGSTVRSTTFSCRSAKAMPPFSTPPFSTPPATTALEDIHRMANLLQISSSFGRAMETIDREAVTNAIYPALWAAQGRRRRRCMAP